jgi:hypothetical protein
MSARGTCSREGGDAYRGYDDVFLDQLFRPNLFALNFLEMPPVKLIPCASRDLLVRGVILAALLSAIPQAFPLNGQPAPPQDRAERDGQHDFDFEIGTWKTHVSRLKNPLSGSKSWVEYEGTTVVRKIWHRRANLAELEADGPAGHLEVLSLRLYDPEAHQWSLNTASSRAGTLGVPTVGKFRNGRGEFFDTETFNGKSILVRNVWSDITPNSCHFEQSFSPDGGETWEVNWVATDTRIRDESGGTD